MVGTDIAQATSGTGPATACCAERGPLRVATN
jgi:hypothetical protein